MAKAKKSTTPPQDPNELRVGLLGFGTVGQGVAQILNENASLMEHRAGRPIKIVRALVRNKRKRRGLDGVELTTKPEAVVGAPDIDVVVELMGGLEPATSLMREALDAGQPVVTANKAVIAKSGPALMKVAARRGVRLSFEAAVAGGVPIIRSLRQGLASDRITSIRGILNGTTNFILSEMARGGTYDVALSRAQELGFAEADPTLDVEGYDAADKIRILAALGFGSQVSASKVSVDGITGLTPETMADADRLGMTIKLIASAERVGDGVALAVSPCLVEVGHPLSAVPSAQNAIAIESDALGLTHFQGPGAGGLPTGSAVVADLLETARDLVSKAPLTLPGIFLPNAPKVLNSTALETRAYIRVMVNDRPGVLSELTGILADEGISIATMFQDDPDPDGRVPVVLTTYRCERGALVRAAKRLTRSKALNGKPTWLPIVP